MPRLPRLTAEESEALLLDAGFVLARVRGSHHIYVKRDHRVVVPFHGAKILHPKIVKQIFNAIDAD